MKEGFAMLFVNPLFNLDELHFNMSNTLTNFRVNLFSVKSVQKSVKIICVTIMPIAVITS